MSSSRIGDTTVFPITAPAPDDLLIGTDVSDTSNNAGGETVNFRVSDLFDPSALAAGESGQPLIQGHALGNLYLGTLSASVAGGSVTDSSTLAIDTQTKGLFVQGVWDITVSASTTLQVGLSNNAGSSFSFVNASAATSTGGTYSVSYYLDLVAGTFAVVGTTGPASFTPVSGVDAIRLRCSNNTSSFAAHVFAVQGKG